MFCIGQAYRAEYPRHNFLGVRSDWEVRRFRVNAIRDPAAEPLDPLTFQINPLRNRLGLLLSVTDLDKGETRSFWTGALRNVEPITALPDGPHDVVLLDADSDPEIVYRAESADEAVAFARRWLREPINLGVGIFPMRQSA